MPKVLNKYKDKITNQDVYIGRGSKWGNPFVIKNGETRESVIEKHKEYFINNAYLRQCLPELKGKNLVCFCSPKPCHGDFILKCVEELLGD